MGEEEGPGLKEMTKTMDFDSKRLSVGSPCLSLEDLNSKHLPSGNPFFGSEWPLQHQTHRGNCPRIVPKLFVLEPLFP